MKKTIIALVITLVATTVLHGQKSTNPNQRAAKDSSWKTLTLREKIGQTMIVVSRYYHHSKIEYANLDEFFKKYPVGGFFIADWYFDYFNPKDSSKYYYIKKGMAAYQSHSKFPLIVMEDFERGVGVNNANYATMPALMSLGAAGNTGLAHDYGKSISMQSKVLGINWLLHPVADLNMNPLHSLLNERTISDDPGKALPLLLSQIKGMKDQRVISTIKHFPGDGATMRDQHLITAINNLDMEAWKASYGKVFQTLIDEGAPSVMVGHITFPAYQKEKYKGKYLPASLSPEIIQGLLKKEMKFKGVVVSDALNMGGASGYYKNELETAIASFAAGIDLMLWPDLSFMDTLEARINREEIPMSRLDDAVERIWALREQYGLLQKPTQFITEMSPENSSFVSKTGASIAENAVTAVQVNPALLPLKPSKDKNILIVSISHTDKSKLFEPTQKLLQETGFNVYVRHDLNYFDWNWRMDSLSFFNKIIVCFENKYFDPLGTPMLKGNEAGSIWTINMLPGEQIIGISYSSPYYPKYYLQNANTLINAYSSDVFMQQAVVRTLLGEIPMKGTSPVNLDNPLLR